jgi:Flp pilus assembly protein TadD/class 3 adenylate cyclase
LAELQYRRANRFASERVPDRNMSNYFASVFTDLVRHSLAWERVPRNAMATIIAEYRYLAQSLAGQYGRRHENFTGDGHLFLFESADVAVHFGLTLIAYWKQRRRSLVGIHKAPDLPVRVGCHFGECARLSDADAWIGRAINVAKRVEAGAEPDSLLVTQTILELIDLPFYDFSNFGLHELKGDMLPQRPLYRLLAVNEAAMAERQVSELTAEDWFLKGVGISGPVCQSAQEEADCYRQALQLRENYPEAHNNLAIILKGASELDAAANHYREAVRLWPQYPECHYNYAILLDEMNDLMTARSHYELAIKHRPDFVDARLRYGSLLATIGDTVEAENQYQQVLQIRPGYPEAHNNYAVFLESNGDMPAAERHYAQAIELNPSYSEAHFNFAMLLERINASQAAMDHYRTALKIVPGYLEAHNNLAVLLQENGDVEGAEAHYRAALRIRPTDSAANYNLGLLLQAKGDKKAAEHHLEMARR